MCQEGVRAGGRGAAKEVVQRLRYREGSTVCGSNEVERLGGWI
jgi:hypothetical protein